MGWSWGPAMAAMRTDAHDLDAARMLAQFRECGSFEWLACEVLISVREWSGVGGGDVPLDRVFQRFWPALESAPSASASGFLARLATSGLLSFSIPPPLDRQPPETLEQSISDALVSWITGGASGGTVRETGLAQSLRNTIGFSLTKTRDANVPGAEIYVSALPQAEVVGLSDVAVLMPFRADRRVVFEKAIRPVCEAAGLSCMRADQFYGSKHIISEIFSLIKGARFVVSDISGLNPNVMYETGIAHAIGRSVLMLAEHGTKVPFDVQHLRRIEYRRGFGGMKRLRETLKAAFAELTVTNTAV